MSSSGQNDQYDATHSMKRTRDAEGTQLPRSTKRSAPQSRVVSEPVGSLESLDAIYADPLHTHPHSHAHAQAQAHAQAHAQAQAQAHTQAQNQALTRIQPQAQALPFTSDPAPVNMELLAYLRKESLRQEGICGFFSNDCADPDTPLDNYPVMVRSEQAALVRSNYMDDQSDLTPRMREVLVDWIHEVVIKFKLRRESLFLAISIMDRYLERKSLGRANLQLLGVASMLISCKYEEIYTPEVNDFVLVADSAYPRERIIEMERNVLETLEFRVTVPYSIRFMERMLRVAHTHFWYPSFPGLEEIARHNGVDLIGFNASIHPGSIFASTVPGSDPGASRSYLAARDIGNYICELVLQEYGFLTFRPSVIGCTAVAIAMKVIGRSGWSTEMMNYSGMSADLIHRCAKDIETVFHKVTKYQAVRRKYSRGTYSEAAKHVAYFFSNPDFMVDLTNDLQAVHQSENRDISGNP